MRQTVVGVFDRYATARQAAQQLRESGFGDSVSVTDEFARVEGDAPDTQDKPRDEGGFLAQVRHFFADLFDDDDNKVSPYAEALRRGGGVVKVEVNVEGEAEAARAALEAAGAVDIDERASEWRASGWQESADSIRQQQSVGIGQRSLNDASDGAPTGMVSPATGAEQSDLTPGAGDVLNPRKSGVRVYAREVQPPADAIETEQLGSGAANAGVVYGSGHRSHFEANYAQGGERWQDYEPAYRYGDELRSEGRYTGRGWDEVEPDLRSDWESRNAGPWEKFKGAIRHGWERMTS